MRRLWQKINTTQFCSLLISFIKALCWAVQTALIFMSIHTLMGHPVSSRIFALTFLVRVVLDLLESAGSLWWSRLLKQEYQRDQTWQFLIKSYEQ